jgi:hypothetical protein
VVKILVQGFCLFNGKFDLRLTEPRSVIGWLPGRVRPKVSGSQLVSLPAVIVINNASALA